MALAVRLVYFAALIFVVKTDPPDCGIRNQFGDHCFSFVYCTKFGCSETQCGFFPRHSILIKIQQTRIIPQCAVTNSTTLKHISGINSNIDVLASGSFAYLPNLESILLSHNRIRELHHGIFYDVNVPLLDLSWNKIIYISEGAFNGITGLKHLNLSRNELSTIPIEYLPKSIVQINLSYNFLERIAVNGAKQPDLTSLDFSYNNLKNVALSFDNTLKELDLTHNYLENIDFYDIKDCENLKIRSNRFSRVPKFLRNSRIRRVAIHPNPWKCDELKQLWSHLQNNNIEEEKPNDADSQPLCSLTDNVISSRLGGSLDCDEDSHCEESELCRAHRCSNPCENSICDSTNICRVSRHQIECNCPENLKKNPMEISSPCYDVECFSENDCPSDKTCKYNNTCAPFPSYTGGFGASSGAAYHPPPGYGFLPSKPGAGFPAAYVPVGPLSDFPAPMPMPPWWFKDIPKLTPSYEQSES